MLQGVYGTCYQLHQHWGSFNMDRRYIGITGRCAAEERTGFILSCIQSSRSREKKRIAFTLRATQLLEIIYLDGLMRECHGVIGHRNRYDKGGQPPLYDSKSL